MVHKDDLDSQLAFHLIPLFLDNLNQAIIQQELLSFFEVPQLYTKLFSPPAAISRGTERNKINDTSPHNQNGQGGGGGSREYPAGPIKEAMTLKTLVLMVAT